MIQMIAVPDSRRRRFTTSRICAWMVTSRAVVGSSAIRTLGLQASAMAIITPLAHAAREPVWKFVEAAGGGRDADPLQQLHRPLARVRATHAQVHTRNGSVS